MIKSIISSPNHWFWHSSMLIILLFCFGWTKAIDLQFHNTYLVIAAVHIGIICSIYLSLVGYVYWLLRKVSLISWMTFAHVVATIAVAFGLGIFSIMNGTKYFALDNFYSGVVAVVLNIFLVSQAIFIINIIVSLFRK